jgi:polyketide biosynthesis 3-hydroxy-3-methylglutaryl-CoA synthase-like enzyme PksG
MNQPAVGIEAISLYCGPTVLDVRSLFEARNLDLERFDNLMMKSRSVGLPCEDPVTNGVNAAKPIIDRLSDEEKNAIELVIAASESGIDFGKAMSTYIHDYLGLSRHCRVVEMKQACYAGTGAMQLANCFVASNTSPGAKALIIATDTSRFAQNFTYAEPSQGVGSVAILVSDRPRVMEIDLGAMGYYSYEVMDTCRPVPGVETGDADLSLMAYLECYDQCFKEYCRRVQGVDVLKTFDYFAYHTPFGGMVKGAHRKLLRSAGKLPPQQVEEDFQRRVAPSLEYCVQVGNVYSATLYFALCGIIDHAPIDNPMRVGMFSYGSGCSSEFYSGLIQPRAKQELGQLDIQGQLDRRYRLNMDEYERILSLNNEWMFGVENKEVSLEGYEAIYRHFMEGRGLLLLDRVKDYHREYRWS